MHCYENKARSKELNLETNIFNNYEGITKKQSQYWLPTVKYG